MLFCCVGRVYNADDLALRAGEWIDRKNFLYQPRPGLTPGRSSGIGFKKIGPLERLAIPAKHCAVNGRKIDIRPLRRHLERGLDKFTYRL